MDKEELRKHLSGEAEKYRVKLSKYIGDETEELLESLIKKYREHPSCLLGVLASSLMIIGCQLEDKDCFKALLEEMLKDVDRQHALTLQYYKDMEDT